MNRSLIDVQLIKCEGNEYGPTTGFIEITNLTDETLTRVSVDWDYRIPVSRPSPSKSKKDKPSDPTGRNERISITQLPADDEGSLLPSATRRFFFAPDDWDQLLSVIASVSSELIAVVIKVEWPDGSEWQEKISGRELGHWIDRMTSDE